MELRPDQMRTWANINLDSVRYNYSIIRNKLKTNTKLCCVVKANAYGHGAVQLSKLYEKLGADYLAVSNIEEALQLRHNDISIPILVLGYTNPRCASLLAQNNISQCVFSYEYGEKLALQAIKQNVKVKTHIKIDSGMGRIGFKCNAKELDSVVKICNTSSLEHEGIFTHFASADEGLGGEQYTRDQFDKFIGAIGYLEKRDVFFNIHHCANSAAIFDYPEMHLDMVRAGIVLYGLQPSNLISNAVQLKPVMTLCTIIDHIKSVHAGEFISYGRDYQADHDVTIATIPIGYADGLWRSNGHETLKVEVNGNYAPIVGRICMDQCMIDITDIADVHLDDEVVIYGCGLNNSVDRVASDNNTINYEVVCAVGERVPRIYNFNGSNIAVVDSLV